MIFTLQKSVKVAGHLFLTIHIKASNLKITKNSYTGKMDFENDKN